MQPAVVVLVIFLSAGLILGLGWGVNSSLPLLRMVIRRPSGAKGVVDS
jgi:hypothetical protein